MGIIKNNIFITLITITFCNSDVNSLYDRAINSYKNERFADAIIYLNKIQDLNYESDIFYYNLGNAYYMQNNMPYAIWAFEKCLKLNPLNEDAIFNLKLANLNVKDRIEIPSPPYLLKMFRLVKSSYLPSEWILIWGLILFLISIVYMFRVIFYIYRLKVFEFILFCIFFISLFPGTFSIYDSYNIKQGIIVQNKVKVFSAPSASSTELFKIHGGLKIDIKETNNNWLNIKLLDGKEGWIKINQVLSL